MSINKEELIYYARFDERVYELEPPEPNPHGKSFMYQGSSGLDFNIHNIYRTKVRGLDIQRLYPEIQYGYEDIPIGEIAYAVIVKYHTGDTFGSHEVWCIPAIRSDIKESYEILADCEKPLPRNDPYTNRRAWDGYFEHLLSVRVQNFTIL